MPTYEYRCKKCRRLTEIFQKMSDDPLTRCPHCQGKMTRLIGAGSGIIFKGSGFYATDYRNPASKEKENVSPPKEEKKTEKPNDHPSSDK